MPVEEHPRYPEWRAALDHLNETEKRHQEALGTLSELAAQHDWEAAQQAYERISAEIGYSDDHV